MGSDISILSYQSPEYRVITGTNTVLAYLVAIPVDKTVQVVLGEGV
jgi:hypothetical protein